ncbi:MAG: peptidoglycan bridge formation glycyltransferase FemA/FemB family protein [Patescibacteria group bacterium]|jgi:lipid II:glycine glycyltransferase (peptidoglycan interpeptide bridge formation enzyme)
MNIVFIKHKEILNEFIGNSDNSVFHQSWEWGEFQEKAGQKVFRLGAEDGGKLVAAATLIKKPLFFGKSYFYCPRGPIVNYKLQIPNYKLFFDAIKDLAKQQNAIFLRFEPENNLEFGICLPEADPPLAENLEFARTLDVQPSKTAILNLSVSEEELLKEMHPKTRYNIRLAEKKGVIIREAEAGEFDSFWCLLDDTCKRDGFRLHGEKYYDKMLSLDCSREKNSKENLKIKLYFAVYNSRVIAANIVGFFGDTVTYIHGASSSESRNVMAPFLLQWETIKLAKCQGYRYYDFYGIDEKKWPGVTRFKRGFGGREISYPGTFDMVFENKWYKVYSVFRVLRKFF